MAHMALLFKWILYRLQATKKTRFFLAENLSSRTYFGMLIGDQDMTRSPHVCCRNYMSTLERWLRGKIKCVLFAIPKIWRESTNHPNGCYFCVVDESMYRKSKYKNALLTRAYNLELLHCHILKIFTHS